MKWNQTVKEEIINEAKATAKACLIAGFSHSYGTAEEFENDNAKMIAQKNVFFCKACRNRPSRKSYSDSSRSFQQQFRKRRSGY